MKKIDAYRRFVAEATPGYISFLEAINHTITKLEQENIIGKTSLKSRIKTVNSALTNTEEKALDDIFGFEIVTQNERDKEILMLIIHSLFTEDYIRHKNHNKSNGYFAHHCTGAVKRSLNGTEVAELEKHILESETNELKEQYRDMSNKEQKGFEKNKIYSKRPRYPTLRQEILEMGQIDTLLRENFEKSLFFIDEYLERNPFLRKNIPVIEVQFKTRAVENEIRNGRAQHVKYKKVNEEDIIRRYFERNLSRGVDFPFVLVRSDEGEMQIEHTSITLISMWPFLQDAVTKYSEIHSCPVANYDTYFAKVFPALEPYVQKNLANEPSLPVNGCDEEIAWCILKNKIINNSFILPHSDEVLKVVGRNN